ncbi:hypothetical protein EJ08DRAFT_650869 [Tothia fuscella]|uniref:GPI anchored protein n=1 Tax=Tothia fuscella TaxID=1048955 RepID=A0A9P4NNT9_9PEZI|nr:hypothetical protein EJ08DRAFT_650869 [Tothia fuscella]
MWHVKFLQFALLVSIAAARAQSDIYSPFLEPLLGESFNPDNTTLPQLELLKRQTSTTNCPSNHINCGYAGNSGVCCRNTANCAVDTAGHVACCPLGAVCTGQIAGTAVAGGGAATTTGTSTGTSFVFASSTTTSNNAAGTVIIGGGASGTQTGFTFTTGTGTTSGAARSYGPAHLRTRLANLNLLLALPISLVLLVMASL